jgi:alpha-N-arabinofuranosidase
MRKDVIELVRELKVPIVRYPGGNFVSAYNWEDGVGPRKARPTRLDLAWHTSESNAVGVHEFAQWSEAAGAEMMLAINLGSRGLDEARNFVEYVNGPTGSAWGDLRKKHGRSEPFAVRHWCLGNEMDGPWQVGHKTADEYGRLANEVAKTLRAFDRSLELIVCGSSNSDMKSYPEWERIVLEHTYDAIDHISLHMYFANRGKNTAEYLALNAKLDAYIGAIASTIEFVRARKRSRKRVTISFDEWNVWYHSNVQDREILAGAKGWPHAPRLLEDIYNFEDALQVGCILNTFIRRSDVVKIACIAQLVNVIAPIMTEPGGPAWRQTTFFPFSITSRLASGEVIRPVIKAPRYHTARHGEAPVIDAVATVDDGRAAVFLVNRDLKEATQVTIDVRSLGCTRITEAVTLADADVYAKNTLAEPGRVTSATNESAVLAAGVLTIELPPVSWTAAALS